MSVTSQSVEELARRAPRKAPAARPSSLFEPGQELLSRRPRRARLADRRRRCLLPGVRERGAARHPLDRDRGVGLPQSHAASSRHRRRAADARRLSQLPREAPSPARHSHPRTGLPRAVRERPRALADLRARLAAASAREIALRRSLSRRRVPAPEARGHRWRARILRWPGSHAQSLGHERAHARRSPSHQRGR